MSHITTHSKQTQTVQMQMYSRNRRIERIVSTDTTTPDIRQSKDTSHGRNAFTHRLALFSLVSLEKRSHPLVLHLLFLESVLEGQ